MFEPIKNLGKKLMKLDQNKILKKIFSEDAVQVQMIDLNQDQLYSKGVDSKGESTGEYSSATIYGTVNFEGKIAKGQPYDHVTLKDSGASYDSMKVKDDNTGVEITGEFPEAVMQGWPDAMGLTEESIGILNEEEIIPRTQEELKNKLLK